jgi:tetratricopeptide (TPR) repeat protein
MQEQKIAALSAGRSLVLALFVLGAFGSACAPMQHIQMEEVVLKASPDGEGHRVEVIDPEELFHAAAEAFRNRDYAAAEQKYALILERFADTRWGGLSKYNRAVCLLKLERWEEAAVIFGDIAEERAGTKDAHDALFQLATCHEKMEQWVEVDNALTLALAPAWKGIIASDRLEAYARRGVARRVLGKLKEAERDLRRVVDVYASNREDVVVRESPYVSLAEFTIGEMHRDRFSAVKFRLPLDDMQSQLQEKIEHFLRAQNAYLRTVRHHHPEYAVRAGFMLGALFEMMTDDMQSAEVPEDLPPDELAVYQEELRKELMPLAEKAVDIFKRTIRLGRKFTHDGEWIKRTEKSLNRMQALVDEGAKFAAEEAETQGEAQEAETQGDAQEAETQGDAQEAEPQR